MEEAIKSCNDFTSKFQAYITPEQLEKIHSYSFNKNKRWEEFYNAMKRVYLLLILYCSFLLFYGGIESLLLENKQMYYEGLGFVNIFLIVYILLLWFLCRWKHIFKTYTCVVVLFLTLILIFSYFPEIKHFFIEKNISFRVFNQKIDFYTKMCIWLCFGGILIIALDIIYNYFKNRKFNKSIKKLSQDMELLFNKVVFKSYNGELSKKIENHLGKYVVNHGFKINDIDDFLKKEIDNNISVHFKDSLVIRIQNSTKKLFIKK